jgi:ABC-type phosphate/phosphonate transport system substrate-binding protein
MTRNPVVRLCGLAGLGALIAIGLAGCAASKQVGDAVIAVPQQVGKAVMLPMRVLLKMQKPVRIGITRVHINPLVQTPWALLEQDLGKKLGRPVQVITYRPFQLQSQLQRGYLDFAILSATDYAEVGETASCQLLAQPVNVLGTKERHGLILAKKNSKIQAVADLKGQHFAFGPSWDAASHLAAAYAFLQAGLEPSDIARELVPVPMARRHHLDSFEVGKAVAYEPLLQAGAVDEVDYSSWPDKGGSILLQTISKDEFRLIATTVALPEGPIVASPKAEAKLVETMKAYLLSGHIPEKALKAMSWQRIEQAQPGDYAQAGEMVRKLREAGWVTEEVPQAPAGDATDAISRDAAASEPSEIEAK